MKRATRFLQDPAGVKWLAAFAFALTLLLVLPAWADPVEPDEYAVLRLFLQDRGAPTPVARSTGRIAPTMTLPRLRHTLRSLMYLDLPDDMGLIPYEVLQKLNPAARHQAVLYNQLEPALPDFLDKGRNSAQLNSEQLPGCRLLSDAEIARLNPSPGPPPAGALDALHPAWIYLGAFCPAPRVTRVGFDPDGNVALVYAVGLDRYLGCSVFVMFRKFNSGWREMDRWEEILE